MSLFAERAHAAAPDFELTGGNAGAVAEICRRLDGLPLAVELAAARVRLLPPQALLSRLDERFSLLTGGARDLPERQQTLRNTLDWSFGLLPASERELFARLGVFAGSFGLPAAEAIGAGSPDQGHARRPGQVMDTLGALVDSSLVRPDTRGGEPRFSLLETIREYALDRLREGELARHGRSAALVLQGEPGTGKTTLLDYAVESGRDFEIVRLLGIESETELGFAALHQLLLPFQAGLRFSSGTAAGRSGRGARPPPCGFAGPFSPSPSCTHHACPRRHKAAAAVHRR